MVEIICINCGSKHMASRVGVKYCSKHCCDSYNERKKRKKPEIAPEMLCQFNVGVECQIHNQCGSCGWNPAVCKKRMEALARG
jgi:hypothetical protein